MTKARDISKLLSTANGKIAGASLDVSFENISDSGTAGTKVASGTTNQRGSTAGQIRFNTTTGLAEYYTGTEFKIIDSPPTVTVVSPLLLDSNAGGNITFTISGSNFNSGAVVKFVGNDATEITASTTTVNSGSSISAIIARSSFVNAKEPYDVKVINSSGLSGVLDNQINVDTPVAWSTSAGTLGTFAGETSQSITLTATDSNSDTITYSVLSGTLPTGLSLNSSTGVISGTLTDVASQTTYTFTIRASTLDANADRAFSITVNKAPAIIDFLVVAGGGGGGSYRAGGGGGGGFRTSTQSVASGTVITVTVGDGGAGGTNYAKGATGSNSSISGSGLTTITSAGGGIGASSGDAPAEGGNGGSGGGGSGQSASGIAGGLGNTPSTSPSQGNNGGSGIYAAPKYGAGGGGGAGAVGSAGTSTTGGNGGNGTASSITGSSITYAGGGAGGGIFSAPSTTGGTGGGGNSPSDSNGTAGTANLGGGGGGANSTTDATPNNGAAGGKGVVILSVPTAKYSSTTTGSPTVTTKNAGADTVLTFTGSGTYTG
jgi:hypothetical protein